MTDEVYDSRPETIEHIKQVQKYLYLVARNIARRAILHDQTKLVEPELSVFNEFTPLLRDSTYGSEEYKNHAAAMGAGLEHHYENNDHHPEYYEHGIKDMSLLALIEMLCDWKAASERHDDGDLIYSIELNQERFGYSDELKSILLATVRELGL